MHMRAFSQIQKTPAGIVRRAWGRAPVPVYISGSRWHDWFYRKNRNLLPLSYGEVWARLDQIGSLI